ncbi:MAG: glycoside hydrolase family 16 protein [Terracidiphilus sp.]|jgi:beta-glucanase (GH16 family)
MRPDTSNPTSKESLSGLNSSGARSSAPSDFHKEREELHRVLDHPEISRSAGLVRFLSFICTKYFDGEADEIREYSIAVEALGRKEASFDSRVDPIVRVTARALRKKLADFYEVEGKDDPLQIVLPLGHYVPQFIPRPEPGSHSAISPALLVDDTDGDSLELTPDYSHQRPSTFRTRLESIHWGPVLKGAAVAAALAIVFTGGFFFGRRGDVRTVAMSEPPAWGDPIWSDEFDGAAQQSPDPSKWSFDTGSGGWGERQIQIYCAPGDSSFRECNPHRPNAFLDGSGHLVLRAEKTPDGFWTSARITTKGLKNIEYGRVEARMKLPVGTGLWPSFWMLGSDFPAVGWPASGSFDFIENVALKSGSNGLGPSIIRSTLHGPHYYGANGLWHDFRMPNGTRVDDGFHTYGAIWSPGMIQFYVDDPANVYFVASSSSVPEGGQWVFDHPFFLVINLAIGGDWPGDPDATTPNPADIVVDYVRVYKIPTTPAPSIQWQPVQVKTGSTVASNVLLSARRYSGRVHLSCSTEPATAVCSLATPVVNFSDTLSQQDTITLSTDSFTSSGRIVAPPGRYKVTITATSISGDHSQLTVPFDVR